MLPALGPISCSTAIRLVQARRYSRDVESVLDIERLLDAAHIAEGWARVRQGLALGQANDGDAAGLWQATLAGACQSGALRRSVRCEQAGGLTRSFKCGTHIQSSVTSM